MSNEDARDNLYETAKVLERSLVNAKKCDLHGMGLALDNVHTGILFSQFSVEIKPHPAWGTIVTAFVSSYLDDLRDVMFDDCECGRHKI